MTGRTLEFWFDFASTYSYLSALRIEDAAARAGVTIVWRPFLLGPIFQNQGWSTSPFNVYPAKGRYMVRDITRIASARGHAFQMPLTFPANSVAAARIALAGDENDDNWTARFSRAIFSAQFADGADIADATVFSSIARALGGDADAIIARSTSDDVKTRLRDQTSRAQTLGIFGAPAFIASDGELFWGDDRLEHALAWTFKSKA